VSGRSEYRFRSSTPRIVGRTRFLSGRTKGGAFSNPCATRAELAWPSPRQKGFQEVEERTRGPRKPISIGVTGSGRFDLRAVSSFPAHGGCFVRSLIAGLGGSPPPPAIRFIKALRTIMPYGDERSKPACTASYFVGSWSSEGLGHGEGEARRATAPAQISSRGSARHWDAERWPVYATIRFRLEEQRITG